MLEDPDHVVGFDVTIFGFLFGLFNIEECLKFCQSESHRMM